MNRMVRIAVAGGLVFALSGCTTLGVLFNSGPSAAVTSVVDGYVPPSVTAPVANSVKAAEGFYTAAANVIAKAIARDDLSAAAVDRIDPIEQRVYTTLVAARTPAAAGQDATAALATFNAAYGDLYKEAITDGIALPTTLSGAN